MRSTEQTFLSGRFPCVARSIRHTHETKRLKTHPLSYSVVLRTVMYFKVLERLTDRDNQRQFSENICLEDDLRSRIFGTFVVKFLACLHLLRFSNI